jgi:hypothetical protein
MSQPRDDRQDDLFRPPLSYLRLAKHAAIMVGRYTHAHQFNRARCRTIPSSVISP